MRTQQEIRHSLGKAERWLNDEKNIFIAPRFIYRAAERARRSYLHELLKVQIATFDTHSNT